MHANEAPTHTVDRTFEVDRPVPPPRTDGADDGEPMGLDEEEAPEEAGYGYGV
jgi:hypothetical protein